MSNDYIKTIKNKDGSASLAIGNNWTISHVVAIEAALASLSLPKTETLSIGGKQLGPVAKNLSAKK